jgi:type III restriction enzyme
MRPHLSPLHRQVLLGGLIALNDEAHHVHDDENEWNLTLLGIHAALPRGLSLWLDFSATPKDQNGTYFPWIICDYPLAQAVEDRIVKAPLIVHRVNADDPEDVSADTAIEAYGDWLLAALTRWKEHYQTYKPLGQKPVLFIMAERNDFADQIGKWLIDGSGTGLQKGEVLTIHVKEKGSQAGEIQDKDIDKLREAARDVDLPRNPIKVIVSVLMLREGWDVRNVTVVLGLRPFTSKAKILPEQAVGRGLRLMPGISPDRTQTLEVMGTAAFEDFVRQLETEGVGIRTVNTAPPPPVKIEPVQEKLDRDITIPLTKPVYTHNYKRLAGLDPLTFEPIYDREELAEEKRLELLRMEFATTETEVHQVPMAFGPPPPAQELIAAITNRTMAYARLTGEFSALYPIIRQYIANRCFGTEIDLDSETVRDELRQAMIQEGIARYLARKVGELTAEKRAIQFEDITYKLSDTKPFTWRRNLPSITSDKTIFNLIATYNDFEKRFAAFLHQRCRDVERFAALGNTEQ